MRSRRPLRIGRTAGGIGRTKRAPEWVREGQTGSMTPSNQTNAMFGAGKQGIFSGRLETERDYPRFQDFGGFARAPAYRPKGVPRLHLRVVSSAGALAAATLLITGAAKMASGHPPRIVDARPVTRLEAAWSRLVGEPGLVHSTVSAYAYNITRHTLVAAIHPAQRETPGSLVKLFTSAAALHELGPDFTYTTKVMVSAADTAGHPGPIFLIGGGDPWLEANGSTQFETLAAKVAARVKAATQVIGVSSAFTPPTYGIGWPKDDLPLNFAAGTAALMAERNEIFVTVAPGVRAGQAPSVHLAFNSRLSAPSYFRVIDRATTGAAGSASTIAVTRRIGTNDILVTGSIPRGAGSGSGADGPWVLSVGNPALFAATLFQNALRQDGVTFTAAPSLASAAPSRGVTIAVHTSPPLSQYLPIQNQYSINQMAENLYRALGMKAFGTGSPAASAAAMAAFARIAGVSSERVQVDGSGLSPLDEMSAQEVVQLLTYASTQPWFSTFRGSLMHLDQAASCGILCPPAWTYALPSGTALWVKTGNLSNQWNYAGYARTANGDLIAFAVLDDGTPTVQNALRGAPADQMMEDVAFVPNVPLPALAAGTAPTQSGTLPADARRLLAEMVGNGAGTSLGVSVVNTATDAVVYQQNGDKLLRAGLLPRLVLADAALRQAPGQLPGPRVSYTGILAHGTVRGALIIDGAHASDLTSATLARLAADVARAGIKTVSGPLAYVGGPTGFHSSRWPFNLPWNDLGKVWAPPTSQLMLNEDAAALRITAGVAGRPATVAMSPPYVPVAVRNETVTTASSHAPTLAVHLAFGTDTFVVSGTIPAGFAETIPIAPADPGQYAARAFAAALSADGVTVEGGLKETASMPRGTLVAATEGPLTAEVVAAMLRSASAAPAENLEADLGPHLWTDIGRAIGSAPNYLVDPTGLALGNYLTADGVSTMLARAYRTADEEGLVAALQHPWITLSPEESALAAFIPGPGGAVYAMTAIRSGLIWNGHFTPQILSVPG